MTENRDNQGIILAQRPDGLPNPDDFALKYDNSDRELPE